VGEVLHGELALALRHAPQVGRVAEHVVQRDMGLHDHVVALRLRVLDHPLAAVDIPYDRPLWWRDQDTNDVLCRTEGR